MRGGAFQGVCPRSGEENKRGAGRRLRLCGVFCSLPEGALLTNGAVVFRISSIGSNDSHDVTLTTNLNPPIAWQTILTNTSSSNDLYQLIDLDSTNFLVRFYRLRSP